MPVPLAGLRTALILTGGGARAAYQAGVLAAIAGLLPAPTRNPFPILCGTSAGAINAATLACQAENFRAAVDNLLSIWRNMRADHVYRADPVGIGLSGGRWLSMLALGWLLKNPPRSLLDNSPLRHLLARHLDLGGIDRAIAAGALHAVSITASGYESGESVSFFQARGEVEAWRRTQRIGSRVRLDIHHLMASSAIPFIFPAVRIHREYFGDGSMRQQAPISPAIHLGAERVLVIGAGRMTEPQKRLSYGRYPTLAQIAGHALSSIFLDSLSMDIERIQRINQTLSAIPEEAREAARLLLRPIRTLVIAPSKRLDHLAARHARALPWAVKVLLTGIGAMNRHGGALTSYLLFEQPYTRALIELGYQDTLARAEEVRDFLEI
ncbi:MAG: Patatin [Rhodocyclaceae bacterium]|nr:Patatin [Rhodocyclaceae bacterium]